MTINLTIKTKQSQFQLQIDQNKLGSDLRAQIAEQIKEVPEQLQLINKTSVVKDNIPLCNQKIFDNSKITVMIKQSKATIKQEPKQQVSQPKPQIQQPRPQQKLQLPTFQAPNPQDILNNPQLMNQFYANPQLQQLTQNKEFMRNMIKNNPQFQKLIKSHPELEDQLQDENIDEMIDTLNDPVKMDEMIQQSNKSLENLQNQPGGQEILQKLQDDLMNGDDFDTELQMLQNQKTNQNNWLPPDSQQDNKTTDKQISQIQNNSIQNQEQYTYDDYDEFPASYCSYLQNSLEKSKYTQEFTQQVNYPTQNSSQQPQYQFNGSFEDLENQYKQQSDQYKRDILNNPQAQQYMEEIIQDPQIIDQMIQMAQDPVQFQYILQMPEIQQQMKLLNMTDPEQFRQFYLQQLNQLKMISNYGGNFQNQNYQQNQQNRLNLDDLREKYKSQLKQIREMGIEAPDEEILQLLFACDGNVEAVINQLFS